MLRCVSMDGLGRTGLRWRLGALCIGGALLTWAVRPAIADQTALSAATARPKVQMVATPKVSPAGVPIALPAQLAVQIVPAQHTATVGLPAVLKVQVSPVALTAPIVLTAQTSSGRTVTITPPQLDASNRTAQLTLAPAVGEQPGSYTVQVQATAGSISATSPPATLTLADPECGNGPPVLSQSVTAAQWFFQSGKTPGKAAVHLRVENSGGRLPTPVTLRVFRVGSVCTYGNCINGPVSSTGAVGGTEITLRGGCARVLLDADIPAISTVDPVSCRPGNSTKLSVSAQVQIVAGPELKAGPPLILGCETVSR